MVFLDWLTIHQDFRPGSIPVFGSDWVLSSPVDFADQSDFDGMAFVSFINPETGELERRPLSWKRIRGYSHPGSYDTSIRVRSDGTRLEVSGNPSAYGRMDNLFGFREVYQAVDFYNHILTVLGLPVFIDMRGDMVRLGLSIYGHNDGMQFAHSETVCQYGRPTITQIHLTENIETASLWVGSPDEGHRRDNSVDFLVQLSGYCHQGRSGYLYPNGATVDWRGRGSSRGSGCVGSRRVYHKYYIPAHKLRDVLAVLLKQKKNNKVGVIDLSLNSHIAHVQTLIEHCVQVGMVRHEVELKQTELVDRNLQHIENWTNEIMTNVIYPYQFHRKLKIEETRLQDVKQFFLDFGESPRVANQCDLIHTKWVYGNDINELFTSERTFYRYRKLLLNIGVDIAVPCDISRIPLRVNKINVSESNPPNWYILPDSQTG